MALHNSHIITLHYTIITFPTSVTFSALKYFFQFGSDADTSHSIYNKDYITRTITTRGPPTKMITANAGNVSIKQTQTWYTNQDDNSQCGHT